MASYLFQNIYTNETKVVNSKDSTTAKRVYSNKTWKYVKAVPQQKPKKVSISAAGLQAMFKESCKLVSVYDRIKNYAEDFDLKGLRPMYTDMYDALSTMQSMIRNAM